MNCCDKYTVAELKLNLTQNIPLNCGKSNYVVHWCLLMRVAYTIMYCTVLINCVCERVNVFETVNATLLESGQKAVDVRKQLSGLSFSNQFSPDIQ